MINTKSSLLIAIAVASVLSLNIPATVAAPRFHKDYHSGVAAAQTGKKPLVIVFSAAWCRPCQQMKQSVYPSQLVAPFHDDFIWIYLDVDNPDNAPVVNQHRVTTIPHIALKDCNGKSLKTLRGRMSANEFARILEKTKRS
ncbi:MAG: hypothetical protein CMO61_02230 [Verrucomicrobiales bacterium]|nr:hypothetical protein [Verrucomicrobiales bacterium]|tara:strand:- start:305 stop:727 length:423 start_codon:yes stop_codon:yes gene_type:complete